MFFLSLPYKHRHSVSSFVYIDYIAQGENFTLVYNLTFPASRILKLSQKRR